MGLTGKGLAEHATKKIGTNYVYGMKMESLTSTKLDSLAKSYSSVFTAAYKDKARKKIGTVCTDCSGLIQSYTGKWYSSSALYANAKEKIAISKDMPIGTVVWRSGHVGVYVGNGYVVEAKSIDKGTVKTALGTQWTKGLLFDFMTYEQSSFKVKITADSLNVRDGAGTAFKINTTVKINEVYTIIEESNGWGKLKSGAGWISLKYTTNC